MKPKDYQSLVDFYIEDAIEFYTCEIESNQADLDIDINRDCIDPECPHIDEIRKMTECEYNQFINDVTLEVTERMQSVGEQR